MFPVRRPDFGDRGYDLRPDTHAPDSIVRRLLAVRYKQGRGLRADLHADPAFQAEVTRTMELINAERTKLGMEPLP